MNKQQLPLFQTTLMRHRGDCAVSCLASLLRRPYEEILVTAAQHIPRVLVAGLSNDQIVAVAGRFGIRLEERTGDEINYEGSTGILGVRFKGDKYNEHAVILSHGIIFDPDGGEVWLARSWLDRYTVRTKIDLLEVE